ncbi:hypothetical protein BCE_0648 [Bacillus cereus ATCC 10987]|uniref:Uncharacterized protein n=1 Tax=Bacillus cereus (strain ATCC 10987 / NRS 248) TaxID=222523 RepID=Q73DR4_BACC1|nr:hypothetical protein BCE_0648 [Bacillus cereus ATCC 10987]
MSYLLNNMCVKTPVVVNTTGVILFIKSAHLS